MKYEPPTQTTPTDWLQGRLINFIEESKDRNIRGDNYPVYSVTNAKGFVLQTDYFARAIHSKDTQKYKIFKKYDFGYNPARINVGSIALNEDHSNGLLSPMYTVFRTKECLLPHFLKYWIQTKHFNNDVVNNTAGSVRESLNFSGFANFSFVAPKSLVEQQKIATVLAKVDEAIEKTDELIGKYKRIKQGMIQDLFRYGIDENGQIRSEKAHPFKDSPIGRIPKEWLIRPLTDLAVFQNGKSFPSQEYSDDGIALLRPGNLQIEEFVIWDKEHTTYLPKKWIKIAKEYLVYENELVMNLTAQSLEEGFLARVCMTPKGTFCLLNQRIARFKEKDCNLEFLFWILRSHQFRAQVNRMPQGIKVQHLYNDDLRSIFLAVPEKKEEQRLIAERLFSISFTINKEKALQSKLIQIKKGLMEDLLSGAVRVNHLIKE